MESTGFNLLGESLWSPSSTGYICMICEHALIHPVTTECGHVFCNYCITLWKKNYPFCPVCKERMGDLSPRTDISDHIESFFRLADPVARRERAIVLSARASSENRAVERFSSDEPSEFRALGKSLVKANIIPPRSAVSKKKPPLASLMQDTARLEKELTGVYSKILNMGQTLNAKEDGILVAKYSRAGRADTRPSTAPSTKGVVGPPRPTKALNDIDELLQLTDDVIKIEKFLQRYPFEWIINNEIEPAQAAAVLEAGPSEVLDALDSVALLKGQPLKVPYKMHPAVQDYIDKNCTTKILPVRPSVLLGQDLVLEELPTEEAAVSRQNLASTILKEIQAVQSLYPENERPPTPLPAGKSDLTTEVLKCRESLLNLRTRTQIQGLGINVASMPRITAKVELDKPRRQASATASWDAPTQRKAVKAPRPGIESRGSRVELRRAVLERPGSVMKSCGSEVRSGLERRGSTERILKPQGPMGDCVEGLGLTAPINPKPAPPHVKEKSIRSSTALKVISAGGDAQGVPGISHTKAGKFGPRRATATAAGPSSSSTVAAASPSRPPSRTALQRPKQVFKR